MLTTLNGHELLKTDVTSPSAPGFDIRPIGIASAIYVLAVTALRNTEEYKKQVGSLISPLDFAHGKAGGAEAIVHTVRSQLDARPNAIAIDLDVDNAFQTPFRQKLLDLAYKAPILGPLLKMLYLNPTNIIFNSKSSAPFRVTAERGVAQGDPLSMDLFCAVLSEALAPVDAGLTATNVTLPRFADNMTVVGAVENAFDTAVKIRNALGPTGMQLKVVKCKALLPASLSPAASVLAMARANALGFKIVDGITLCGSPIGSTAYCKSVVQSTFEAACSKMNLIEQLAHFDSTAGGISKQNALVLLRYCVVPASVVHLMRSTPPDLVKEAAASFDDKTETTILSIINSLSLVSTNEERARFNERLHLDAVGGGGGLASALSLADAAYIGSMALTACHAAMLLPPGTSLSAAFPAAKKLLDNGTLREVDSIKDVSLADIANNAIPKVQRLLTMQRRAARITSALAAAASPQDRANLLSQATAEASAFLTVVPGKDKALTIDNDVLPIVYQRWLGLPVSSTLLAGLPDDHNSRICRACAPVPPPNANAIPDPQQAGVNVPPASSIINEKVVGCSHALSCRGGGRNSVAGIAKGGRHNAVNTALEISLRLSAGRPNGSAVSIAHEPSLLNHADPKQANPKKQRADISVVNPDGSATIVDTTVALVSVSSVPTAASSPGAAAAKRTDEKKAKYEQNWTLHNGVKLVVATIESSGRWSPDLIDFLKGFIKAAHPDDTKLFVYKLKAATQRVSVALQRSTSRAILEMNRRATSYPSLRT